MERPRVMAVSCLILELPLLMRGAGLKTDIKAPWEFCRVEIQDGVVGHICRTRLAEPPEMALRQFFYWHVLKLRLQKSTFVIACACVSTITILEATKDRNVVKTKRLALKLPWLLLGLLDRCAVRTGPSTDNAYGVQFAFGLFGHLVIDGLEQWPALELPLPL